MTKHTDFKYTVADDKQSDDKFFFSSSHASDITKNLNHNREQELMSHGTSRNQSNKTVFAVIPAAWQQVKVKRECFQMIRSSEYKLKNLILTA